MEGNSLFNPGFLGAHFNWWIGQIASDSTWRDNILPGKFESKDQIPGWGRRYKVRIIGLHDQGESEIPSDKLPWAQVMYPVTGGGGQANASATANLRQGMFVFGFFLDGQEQQVPVIMGVLGNNAQTELSTKIGDNKVTNTQPGSLATSGYATPADGNKDTNLTVPDEGLVVTKPRGKAESNECAPIPPGVQVNQYGLRTDKSLTSEQYRDQQNAIAEAEARGLTGTEKDNFVQQSVANGIAARCKELNSPTSPSQPGATRENVDAVHELSIADVKRNEYYHRKTVLLSVCDIPQSALKGIQTELENLTKDIDKVLNAANSYIDAASNTLGSIQSLIKSYSSQISKYMKIVFDKIKEYVLKETNKSLSKTIDMLPPNQRHRYADIKTKLTETISCLFDEVSNKLTEQIMAFLEDQLNTDELPSDPNLKAPTTPICSVESLTGDMIAVNSEDIMTQINEMLSNIDDFLNDVQGQLGLISKGKDMIGSISGSITSALKFDNLDLKTFKCSQNLNCPASDYYTIQNGSGAAEDPQQPRASEVDKKASTSNTNIKAEPPLQFALPSVNESDINYNVRIP